MLGPTSSVRRANPSARLGRGYHVTVGRGPAGARAAGRGPVVRGCGPHPAGRRLGGAAEQVGH